jgi:hypothetical protein
VLQWAQEYGCPWDAETCLRAATGGRSEMLQWAREQGCRVEWRGHMPVLRCYWTLGDCAVGEGAGVFGIKSTHECAVPEPEGKICGA